MASQPPMQPQDQAPQTTDEQDSNVSPEEQAEYSEFEENYMRLIYDGDQVRPELLESLKSDGGESDGNGPSGPVMALANTAVQIVTRIDDAAREAGKPVSDDVLFHGGVSVIEELAQVAQDAGIYDYSEKEMGGALTVAMDMYRDKAVKDGRTDEGALNSEWERLIEADKQGQADAVAPGITQAEQQ